MTRAQIAWDDVPALKHLHGLRLRGQPTDLEAMEWVAAQSDQSPSALYRACPRGDWLLWYREASGLDTGDMAYVCAERARQYALRAMPPGPTHDRLAACAPVVDRATAAAVRAVIGRPWAGAGAGMRVVWMAGEAAADAAAGRAWGAASEAAGAASEAAGASAASGATWASELATIAELVRARWPEPPCTEEALHGLERSHGQ